MQEYKMDQLDQWLPKNPLDDSERDIKITGHNCSNLPIEVNLNRGDTILITNCKTGKRVQYLHKGNRLEKTFTDNNILRQIYYRLKSNLWQNLR